MTASGRADVVIVGGGHNGLVAAALLARAGRSVLVLERRSEIGGAAVSGAPFSGLEVRLSRYAYLVSLFPRTLLRSLAPQLELRVRRFASYTPRAPAGAGLGGEDGLLIGPDAEASAASMARIAGAGEYERWQRFYAKCARVGERVFPTLTEPLRARDQLRRVVDDDVAWEALFEQPLSIALERSFTSDLVRGVVLTDATIGTFAPASDPDLRQNRCFLYHVIGNGTGSWDVPVGGMGALTDALAGSALAAGAEIRTNAEVVAIETDGEKAEVSCAGGERFATREVLAAVAPAVLSKLLGEDPPAPVPEGAQLKVNMLLERLPRLRDRHVSPEQAFSGTFHVNESYEQLDRAYAQARDGEIPRQPPCEVYCHSLSDPSILSPELRAIGAQTLTLFGLHMPARLFSGGRGEDAALSATLRSLDAVLAEPIEDCLWVSDEGRRCLEVLTPLELESELAMPGGHIFHRDLSWPFAESEEEVGRWGVETAHPNVWLCGAGARRGGGVSGIPGHNAARAVLEARR